MLVLGSNRGVWWVLPTVGAPPLQTHQHRAAEPLLAGSACHHWRRQSATNVHATLRGFRLSTSKQLVGLDGQNWAPPLGDDSETEERLNR